MAMLQQQQAAQLADRGSFFSGKLGERFGGQQL